MAPRSKVDSKKEDKVPESTSSRRSARIAGSAAPVSEVKEVPASKKRGASAPKSGTTASKKAKTAPTSKSTKSTPKTETIKEDNEDDDTAPKDDSKAAEEEKKEEAPKSAKADTGSSKPIKLGDKLPSIELEDEDGKKVDVATLTRGGKGVVVFLYPKADTPGCTNQACGFRDAHEELKELGYDVYGLSKDKPTAQQKWKTKKELNYHLLSDPTSQLIKKLGAFVHPNNTKRSHFIFSKDDGKLIDLQLGVKPADDPTNCVKLIKSHHK